MRTSETDPIRVDFLPGDACRVSGRIGLTFAPGKKDPYSGWNRSVDADVRRLVDHYQASLLVSLIEDSELRLLGIEHLIAAAECAGLCVCRLPIADKRAPESATDVVALVHVILGVASAGDTVVIHCRGGLGRAGALASCCLVAQGHHAQHAMGIVRAARPDAVETREQERFVETFAEVWRTAPPLTPSSSKFRGCLLGGALGDALGYPVEFLTQPADIDRVLGGSPPDHLPFGAGGRALVSDDTQMTLFTAEGIVRAEQRFRERGMASVVGVLQRAYHRWFSTQTGLGADRWHGPAVRGWLLDVAELHARRAPGTRVSARS